LLEDVLSKPMGRGMRPACDSGVLPVTLPKGSDGSLLVQSLAPDVEVEESNSELAQKETISARDKATLSRRRTQSSPL
jgi:hypothetical protein